MSSTSVVNDMLDVSNLAPAANTTNSSDPTKPFWNGSIQTLNKFILELEQLLQLDGDAWQLIHEQSISLSNGKTVISSTDIIPVLEGTTKVTDDEKTTFKSPLPSKTLSRTAPSRKAPVAKRSTGVTRPVSSIT